MEFRKGFPKKLKEKDKTWHDVIMGVSGRHALGQWKSGIPSVLMEQLDSTLPPPTWPDLMCWGGGVTNEAVECLFSSLNVI